MAHFHQKDGTAYTPPTIGEVREFRSRDVYVPRNLQNKGKFHCSERCPYAQRVDGRWKDPAVLRADIRLCKWCLTTMTPLPSS